MHLQAETSLKNQKINVQLAEKNTKMTDHIQTRKKLKNIPLVKDFEEILSLCTIDEEDKEIIRMHYLHGKDFRYIGDTFGYSERTIKARHKRALKKISNAL